MPFTEQGYIVKPDGLENDTRIGEAINRITKILNTTHVSIHGERYVRSQQQDFLEHGLFLYRREEGGIFYLLDEYATHGFAFNPDIAS